MTDYVIAALVTHNEVCPNQILELSGGDVSAVVDHIEDLQEKVLRLEAELARRDAAAAERERDELRAELKASSANAMSWMKRALLAEKELERRDAAAGEPVMYQLAAKLPGFWKECAKDTYDRYRAYHREFGKGENFAPVRALYAAAPPAVLPPEASAVDMRHRWPSMNTIESQVAAMVWNQYRTDALALGVQPQKVVELKPDWVVGDCKEKFAQAFCNGYSLRAHEDKQALDAANVKWVVKK